MVNDPIKILLSFLPVEAQNLLLGRKPETLEKLEELRFRLHKPVELLYCEKSELSFALLPDEALLERMLERFCAHAVFAREQNIRTGMLLLPGGIRIGLSGFFFPEQPVEIRGFSIRIPRERCGCSREVLEALKERTKDGSFSNTLLLAPPGVGKTTLLRDMIRALSLGLYGYSPERIVVVDEKGELGGFGQLDLGPRSDLLSGLSRRDGLFRAIRFLRPSLLATDELGGQEDAEALFEAGLCGIRILASAHAKDRRAAEKREALRKLLPAFQNCVRLFRNRDGSLGFQVEERA